MFCVERDSNRRQDPHAAHGIVELGELHYEPLIRNAEGAVNEPRLHFLRDHEYDEFQGFLFYRPLPEEDFLALDPAWDMPEQW